MIGAMKAGAWALGAAALLASADSGPSLKYDARCLPAGGGMLGGYVSNRSEDAYAVNGIVTFTFTGPGSIARPSFSLPGNGLVPPGRTVLVARAPLSYQPTLGERCGFDVSTAIRRL